MADSIYELVNAAVTTYLEAKADREKAKAFRDAFTKLVQALAEVNKHIHRLGDRHQHDAAVQAIDAAVTFDESVQLQSFFEQVGEALIAGQRRLDGQSRAYNEDPLVRQYGIPPTWFAIPSVKAEMKLGFSQVSGRGVNVVVFNNAEQKQRYGESTISFEIAAAPAPPSQHTIGEAPPPPVPEPPVRAAAAARPVVEPESILEARETAVADFLEGVEAAPAGFPLRDERKQEVLDLLAKAAPGRRTGEVTVLPATPETGATNLYLVLWGGRDVRAYYGEATRDRFVLRTTIYPHPAPLKQNKALVVPSSAALKRAAAKDPASLRYLVRNLGGVLATVVQHARACRPHFMLADEDDAPAVRRIRRRFPGGIVLLDATQKPALYVMLRPVGEAPGEFSEFDAALFTAKGAPDVVHIPSAAALSRMAEQSPEGLIELIERLRKLIRTLVQLIEHG